MGNRVVMKLGSKSRVRVEFGLQSSGFYRVITIRLPSVFGFLGFCYYECFECQVSGRVRVIPPCVSAFRVPDFITRTQLAIVRPWNRSAKKKTRYFSSLHVRNGLLPPRAVRPKVCNYSEVISYDTFSFSSLLVGNWRFFLHKFCSEKNILVSSKRPKSQFSYIIKLQNILRVWSKDSAR